uniref:Uncharacterized protein n=1 Tax=Solanum tuberosum TaxID=4113 RepID=M1BVW0_SOLTU
MSYIPPHKRHNKGSPSSEPTPAPESLIPAFRKNLNFKRKDKFLFEIRCAHGAVRKWFPVGLTDDSHFSSLVKLQPLSIDRKSDENPLRLVLMQVAVKEQMSLWMSHGVWWLKV